MGQLDKNKFMIVHADCVPVKGYKRSCIYDLTRRRHYFVPNSLADILVNYDGLKIEKLYQDYDYSPILDEYFQFLLQNEIIHQADKWELKHFPKIVLDWKTPSKITTAVIDMAGSNNFKTNGLSTKLDDLGVMHLQIRHLNEGKFDFLTDLLLELKDTRLKSIELILPFYPNYIDLSRSITKINRKVLLIYFYSAPEVKNVFKKDLPKIILTKDLEKSLHTQKSPNPKYFSVNMQLYMESIHHNTFYNRKIFIDRHGNLKNTLFGTSNFGHIDLIDISATVNSKDFQKYWLASKDETTVCRDCEFRYMCTDQRVPEKTKEYWTHDTPCRYDPYSTTWVQVKGLDKSGFKIKL
jgi:SPASM domain peptide maturase of grasp-with-spasm system